MKILLLAAASLVVQMLVFLCLGSVVMKIRGKDDYSLSHGVWIGYFVYFGIFEVVCLACEVALLPLRTLALIMAVFMGGVILLGFFFGYRSWIGSMNSLRHRMQLHGFLLIVMLLTLAASVVFVLCYFDASADSGWYVGEASTALATNTIGRFDPSTGERILRLKSRYALNCFPYHNAVMSSLIGGLPVVVSSRSVMSVINVIMSFISVYELGRALFPDNERRGVKIRSIRERPGVYSRRRADLFVVMVFALNVLSSTIYMPGIFLFTRSYEGKSLIVNVAVPAALAICASLWRETSETPMRDLFWIMASSVCFSASSIMVLALSLMAILPVIAIRGKWNRLPALLLACAPVFAWGVTYYLIQHGVIILRTWR